MFVVHGQHSDGVEQGLCALVLVMGVWGLSEFGLDSLEEELV
jgi:hypothetical protein